VDASLIQTEMVSDGVIRFQMLELIREYARQQLHVAGEEEQCRHRHAAYYARLAETIIAYFGPEPAVRAAPFALALAQELPNARAALEWAEQRREAELGLRLTGFTRLWHVRGQMSEAVSWMERMLALDQRAREQGEPTAPLTLRIERLQGPGRTLVRYGKVERGAEALAQEALQLAQSISDQNSMSNAFATLGMIAQASGKLDEAETAFTESYTHARLIEQRGLMSRALFQLADVAVPPTLSRACKALPPLSAQKGTTRWPRVCVQQQQPFANRHRHYSHRLRAKRSSRLLQRQEQHLTSQPLQGNGTPEQHSRRTRRLTRLCRTEKYLTGLFG
jgi:tetratricopeptide (TPR) repeat protein